MAIHMMTREWTEKNPAMETTYAGRVLATYEVNGYNDSDFKALVWVPAHKHEWTHEVGFDGKPQSWLSCKVEGCNASHFNSYSDRHATPDGKPEETTQGFIAHVEYASTRGWTYPNRAEVDATPEINAAAKASFLPSVLKTLKQRAEKQARIVRLGDEVANVRGRKLPKGLSGVVAWMGEDKFTGEYRIGIDTPEGRVYGAKKNFDPVNWQTRLPSDADLQALAAREVARLDVRSLTYYGAF